MNREVCRTLALGSLLRGYFHNLKGTLQSLSLQAQLLYMKKDLLVSPQAHPNLEKMLQLLEKLQKQIDVALDEVNNEETGPWDLKELMERELLFWEANLFFKHKVKKEIKEIEKVLLSLSLNEIRGLLCLVEERLYPSIKEGASLQILIGPSPNTLTFEIDEPIAEETTSSLLELKPYLEPLVTLEVSPNYISLQFNVTEWTKS